MFSILTDTHTFKLIASLLKPMSDFLSWSPQTVSVDLCVWMTSCSLTFTIGPTLMKNCILIRPMTFAYWAVWEKLGLYPSCAPVAVWQYTEISAAFPRSSAVLKDTYVRIYSSFNQVTLKNVWMSLYYIMEYQIY